MHFRAKKAIKMRVSEKKKKTHKTDSFFFTINHKSTVKYEWNESIWNDNSAHFYPLYKQKIKSLFVIMRQGL